jgi:PTH1 family peptidyl-tRNA hydrolase
VSKLCFIGIGNPGAKYDETKHNIGKDWLIKLSTAFNIDFVLKEKLGAKIATSHNDKVQWIIPENYVNNSGSTIKKIIRYLNLSPENIVIFHDDLDLNPGEIKIKHGGGHGGHNGLKDIFNKIGMQDFYRIRIGIGHPGNKNDVTNWVLSKFKPQDKELIEESFIDFSNVFGLICDGKFSEAQLKLHS